MSSVRFICGTQALHRELEKRVAAFLGLEDAILYAACFDANGGVFEPLLGADDAILTDQLNHASIIDGVRLCKAKRFVYEHADMADLEAKLKEAASARFRMIVTDGVFSMDGDVAPLARDLRPGRSPPRARAGGRLARHRLHGQDRPRHARALRRGGPRGHPHHHLRQGAGRRLRRLHRRRSREVIDLLRQRSRPYLFSNTLAPVVAGATLRALELLSQTTALRDRLEANTRAFRERMTAAGFEIRPGVHPIVPIMFSRFAPDDAPLAQRFARALLDEGIYVKGFFFPVVPRGQSRIRVQISAAHAPDAHRAGGRRLHEGRPRAGGAGRLDRRKRASRGRPAPRRGRRARAATRAARARPQAWAPSPSAPRPSRVGHAQGPRERRLAGAAGRDLGQVQPISARHRARRRVDARARRGVRSSGG